LAATLVLHFALVYSGALGRERSAWAHPLLHLPALGMALVDVATLGVSGRPVRHEWGWGRDMIASAPAHMLAVVCYSLIALALLWVCGWFLRHATRARRHEALVLAGTVGAMVLLGIPAYLADLLQPQAFGFTVPLGAVLVVVLTYLISRYNLFQATPQAAAEDILAMMPEGLALVTPEGRVTQCNHALAELWGGTRSGLEGRTIEELLTADTAREVLRSARAVGPSEGLRSELRRAGGAQIPVRLRWAHLGRRPEECAVHIVLFEDARPHLQREREIQKLARLETLGFLARGLAHDHHNALTVVEGELAVLRVNERLSQEGLAGLDAAESAAMHAAHLVKQLATLVEGRAPRKSECDVEAIVRAAASMALRGRGIEFSLSRHTDLPRIAANPDQLMEVFLNLFLNASQAMYGSGSVRVRCLALDAVLDSCAAPTSAVEVSLSDSGHGVPEGISQRIFEPFFTTKPSGSGLGLAIVSAIVREHGGTVALQPPSASGATFVVTLPVQRQGDPDTVADREPHSHASSMPAR